MPVIPNPDPQVWRMLLREMEKESAGSKRSKVPEEESQSEQSASDDENSVDSSPPGQLNLV